MVETDYKYLTKVNHGIKCLTGFALKASKPKRHFISHAKDKTLCIKREQFLFLGKRVCRSAYHVLWILYLLSLNSRCA